MAVKIGNRSIQKVKIFDDDPRARAMVALSVSDAKLEPIQEPGPLTDLAQFAGQAALTADAAILDHKLKLVGKYSSFDGAEAVSHLYMAQFPAVLCTSWGKAEIDAMRCYRRKIPSLISIEDLDPEAIIAGWERCIQEFSGDFSPVRRPWRALVRVEDVNNAPGYRMFYVVIPGWTSSEKVRLPLDLIPPERQSRIQPGTRFYAEVNIGADNQDELYFENLEFD